MGKIEIILNLESLQNKLEKRRTFVLTINNQKHRTVGSYVILHSLNEDLNIRTEILMPINN